MSILRETYLTYPTLYQEASDAADQVYESKTPIEKQSLDIDWKSGFMEGYIFHSKK